MSMVTFHGGVLWGCGGTWFSVERAEAGENGGSFSGFSEERERGKMKSGGPKTNGGLLGFLHRGEGERKKLRGERRSEE